MKKILLTLITIITVYSVNAQQCTLYAVPLGGDTINCNDSLQINLEGISLTSIVEDFNAAPYDSISATGGAIYTNPYIPSPTNDTYFWMGASAVTPTAIVTVPLNLTLYNQVCFDFVMATQGGPAPAEGPDLSEEGFSFQYNNGSGWVDLIYFLPDGQTLTSNPGAGYTPFGPVTGTGTPFTVWNSVCISLPVGAQVPNVQLRWLQTSNSGACCDNWGLDNLVINAISNDYTMMMISPTGSVIGTSPYDSVMVSPFADTEYIFEYRDFITNDFCRDTVDVYIRDLEINNYTDISCSNLGIELSVENLMPNSPILWSPNDSINDITIQNPFVNPVNTTIYTATSDCGTASTTITVVPTYEPIITSDIDSICVGDIAVLNAASNQGGGYTYTWTNKVDFSTISNPSVNPSASTMFYIEMESDSGCIRNDSILIEVGVPAKNVTFDGNKRICLGDSTQIVLDFVPATIYDDFNDGIDYSIWADVQNGVANDLCGTNEGDSALHFNSANGTNRWAQTISFDASNGGSINFFLKYGTGGVPCNTPGFNEIVQLEYSLDNGVTWVLMTSYAAGAYDNFTSITDTIPTAAQTVNTMFRLVQPLFAFGDNWVIDEFLVDLNCTVGCPQYNIDWTPASTVIGSTTQNPIFYPNVTTTYSVAISPQGFNCVLPASDLTISVDAMPITLPSDTFLCSPSNVQLDASFTLNGDCSEYSVDSTVAFYTLTGTGTNLVFDATDDGETSPIALPFPFEFYCNNVSEIIVSTNGIINMQDNGFGNDDWDSETLPTASGTDGIIAMFWDDLTAYFGGTSTYFVTGTTPNRRFVVDLELRHLGGGSVPVEGQIILHETTNIIDLSCTNCLQFNNFPSVTQGIENYAGTKAHFLSNRNKAAFSIVNQTVRFTPNNSSGNAQIAWTPNYEITDSTIVNPVVSPLVTTDYSINIINGIGCEFNETTQVAIYQSNISLTNDSEICNGSTLQLNAGGADSYTWTSSLDPTSTLNSTTIANPVTSTGADVMYYVTYSTGNIASGVCEEVDSVFVDVISLPVTTLNAGVNPVGYCPGGNVDIYTPLLNGWNYNWVGPETGNTNIMNVSTPGLYTLNFNDGTCSSSMSITVNENANPEFDFSGVDRILCCGDADYVIDLNTLVNNVNVQSIEIDGVLNTTGTFTIQADSVNDNFSDVHLLKAFSTDGCSTIEAIPEIVTKCMEPVFTNPDTVFSGTGEVFDLTINDVDAESLSYEWVTTDNSSGAITDNTIEDAVFNGITEANDYQAYVTVTANFENDSQPCIETSEVNLYDVVVLEDPLYADAFTPNSGDDLNDLFRPVVNRFAEVIELRIYNRWGSLVYDMTNAENKKGWDGKWNNVDQKADLYMYFATVKQPGNTFLKEGAVTLIR